MTDTNVPQLVQPEWLGARLDDPDLRVLDCTVYLCFDPETGERRSTSGRADWEAGHIPESAFADLLGDLSATDDPEYPFQLPSEDRFAAAMERLGVGDDSRVVLYDAAENRWATRVWWLLRTFGFDHAGVLDGGWQRWWREDGSVSTAPAPARQASLTTTRGDRLIVTIDEVRESLDRNDRCLVNALQPADHAGTTVVKYGRPGHIPTSVNVPVLGDEGIVNPDTGRFLPQGELRGHFEAAGVLDCDRVIAYCGGGIAATAVAFALTLVGAKNVAVYDGGLCEWGADQKLPMETE